MQKQLLGSETPLGKTGNSMEQDGSSGKMMIQEVGSKAPIRNAPIELQEMDAVKNGTFQLLGSEAPVSRSGTHGWESGGAAATPMSDRALRQGSGFGGPQKGSKSRS